MIVRERPRLSADKISTDLSEYARRNPQFAKNECFLLFVFGKNANNAYFYAVPQDKARTFNFKKLEL